MCIKIYDIIYLALEIENRGQGFLVICKLHTLVFCFRMLKLLIFFLSF